jgi:hypothetical protein
MVEKKKTIPKPKPRPKQKALKPRPKPKQKKSTMKVQEPPLVRNHYAGLGLAAGMAGYGATSAIQDIMSSKSPRSKRKSLKDLPKRKSLKDLPSYEQRRAQSSAESTNRINKNKVKLAQMRIEDLKKLNTSVMTDKEKKQRKALLKQQQNIVKGLTKTTAKELAKQVGLRAIPFVGAFLAAFDSKPAGAGSAKFGPGSKEKK